jgi:hypothetical protein
MQFWPRVEMRRSFVLSELQPTLFASLRRLEMQICARQARGDVQF